MGTRNNDHYLTGRLLLAMPAMGDPRFHRAVIYVCAHDENGAMGLVVNHTLPGLDLGQLLTQLNINPESGHVATLPVMSGGPVETARGFILHSSDFNRAETIRIDGAFSVTGTVDALRSIVDGTEPQKMLFILGYAGWSAGQLDEEIRQNAWLIAEPDPDLIFSAPPDDKWDRAVKALGIDPAKLSPQAGHA